MKDHQPDNKKDDRCGDLGPGNEFVRRAEMPPIEAEADDVNSCQPPGDVQWIHDVVPPFYELKELFYYSINNAILSSYALEYT